MRFGHGGRMSKKINAPPVWREEITQYLDVLKAGGQSKGTLTTRRCQLSQMARDLQGVPADVSDDALVSWFARHEWKPETRKSYRNAVTGFFSWLHTTGRARLIQPKRCQASDVRTRTRALVRIA